MKLEFSIKYGIDLSQPISAEDLLNMYFIGINLIAPDGTNLAENTEVINKYINAAKLQTEEFLNIKLQAQIYEETFNFIRDNWYEWGYIPTTYPVKEVFSLTGFLNDARQINYPKEWLSTKKSMDEGLHFRRVNIVPTLASQAQESNNIVYSGITPEIGFYGLQYIPNYWLLTYCTGFSKIPDDILNFIGKLAAINLFHILGDLILGAGIAGQSISIDGLSQSITSTSSATNSGYGARIKGYIDDLNRSKEILQGYYTGIRFAATS